MYNHYRDDEEMSVLSWKSGSSIATWLETKKYIDNNKVIYYNWNLKDEAPVETLLVAHGHTHNVCQNGINETMHRIKKFIREQKPKSI